MEAIFARHGIPGTVVSDNGPEYEFTRFAVNTALSIYNQQSTFSTK